MSNIVVRAEKLISRPVGVVQAQFADMAHHEKTPVHAGLDVLNVRPSPSGCRFTGRRRILGSLQESEYEVQLHAGGNSTLRAVSGTARGLEIRQSFEAQGAESTLVRLEVDMPVRGMARLLSPLLRIGIRKDLATALEEDRIDLEERGYTKA